MTNFLTKKHDIPFSQFYTTIVTMRDNRCTIIKIFTQTLFGPQLTQGKSAFYVNIQML